MTTVDVPLTPQQKRDAWAKARGYRNYFHYRDEQAKGLGYSSYRGQRLARKSGIGLQGEDRPGGRRRAAAAPVRRPTPIIVPPREYQPPVVPDIASRYSQRVLLEYKQLEAAAQHASKVVFTNKAQYTPNSRGGRKLVSDFEEKVKTTSLSGLRYARDDLPDMFKDAAIAANPGFALSPEDEALLKSLQREAINGIQQIDRFAKKDAQRYVNDAYKVAQEKGERFALKQGIKGVRFSNGARWSVGNYSDMLIRSNASRTFNAGTLAGHRAAGADVVEVNDGSDCGWEFHKDPDKAQGRIVTIDEALSHLTAHPHCQRTFTPRHDLDKKDKTPRLSGAAKAAAVAAAVSAGVGIAGLYASSQQGRVAAFLRNAYKQNPHFVEYEYRLRALKQRLAQYKDLQPNQLYDFVSGLPIVQTPEQLAYYFDTAKGQVAHMSTMELSKLAELVHMSAEDWLYQGENIPAFVRQVLGVDTAATRQVVGEKFREFAEYEKFRYKYMDQNSLGSLQSFVDLQNRAQDAFYRWATPIGPRWSRFSYPKVGGERFGRYTVLDSSGLVKYTRTESRKGAINKLTFNRNGLLRAGFRVDPETGRIQPDFRLVGKMLPIRINTVPNISKRSGKVISASIDVIFLTPTPMNFKAKFYMNLRSLGVGPTTAGGINWKDLLSVRAGDIRRMKRLDPEFFKIISLGAETRIQGERTGFGRVGPFDFPATFSIPWEEATALWHLTTLYLRAQLADLNVLLRQTLVKGIGDVDWRMFGVAEQDVVAMDQTRAQILLQQLIAEVQRVLNEGQGGQR